jgi:phosphate uptake regulator
MRRKVIQIANSTVLVSLPRKWATKYNVKKGDEITVEPDGATLKILVDSKPVTETAEINLNDFGVMASRVIFALYKKGIDEIKINFDKSEDFRVIQESLKNKTVGFEVVEQTSRSCVIKSVSGQLEEFDPLLRRLFLLLITMSSEGLTALRDKDIGNLNNIENLEETNNRLTQICRRYINKIGKVEYSKIGPLYFIVEELEKLADEYKYLFQYVKRVGLEKVKLSKRFFNIYEGVNVMFRHYTELFYKFDAKKLDDIGTRRKDLVAKCIDLMHTSKGREEAMAVHHLLVISEKIFDMTGPQMVIAKGMVKDNGKN